MKSIGLRPNHHQEDNPTSAHIHISVIGFHVLCGVLKKLRTSGMYEKWKSIRNMLDTHRRETTTLNTEDNKIIDVRSCATPTEKQCEIYRALDIKQTPLKKVKTKTLLKGGDSSNKQCGNSEVCSDKNETSKPATL